MGNDASLTGAPLLLLHFLRWLAINSNIQFEILLNEGGELLEQYSQIAPTYVLNHRGARSRILDFLQRARAKLKLRSSVATLLRRRYPLDAFPVIYSNTVANGQIVGFFGRRGHRVICHAHEMKFAITRWGGDAARESSSFIHDFIAASQAVKRDLTQMWGVDGGKIEVIHEFGQPFEFSSDRQQICRGRIRSELRIPETTIVVGMCGTMDWRKGADLYPQLAKSVQARAGLTRYHFIWVGARVNSPEHFQLVRDIDVLGLSGNITIIAEVRNAQEYIATIDIFSLTSREDPCPLVMLEAAALGIPIVCFAQSGGAPDFVAQDAGRVVPYLDVAAMADAIVELGTNREIRQSLGQKAKARAASEFALQTQAPKLLAVIERNRS